MEVISKKVRKLSAKQEQCATRIARFNSGLSILELATADHVSFKSMYGYLLSHNALSDTYLADEYEAAARTVGLPEPIREFHFMKTAPDHVKALFQTSKTRRVRDYRADYCYENLVIVEIDGGTRGKMGGAHNVDREKRNAYALCGWKVLYFDIDLLADPIRCATLVKIALEIRPELEGQP